MANKGTLTVRVIGDTRDFQRKMGDIGGKLTNFAKKAALAGGALAAAFGVKAVRSAAELNETLSKTEQVFKGSSDRVIKFADDMADAFGLPKNEILDAASNIGLVAKASGLSEEAAAGMSTQMAQLAADASSFFNVPLPTALEKIRAGLVGEAEPLRQFGVLLSAAAVEEKAVAAGIAQAGQELSEQQKVMARSMIIQEQMTDASGDLERTQGSLSNRVRELRGRFENFAAEIGQRLLPVAEKLVDWAINSALPAFERFATWVVASGVPALQAIGDWIANHVVPRLKDMADWFNREVTPRLNEFADAVRTHWPTMERIFEDLGRVVSATGKIIGGAFKNWREDSREASGSIEDDWGTIVGALSGLVGAVATVMEWFERFIAASHRMRIAIHDHIMSVDATLRELPKMFARAAADAIRGFIRGFSEWGDRSMDTVRRWADNVGSTVMRALRIGSPSKLFFEFGENTIQGYIDGIESESTTLQDIMKSVFDDAIGGVGDIISGVSALRGQREAQSGVREAQAELTDLQRRQSELPKMIADAEKALASALAEAKKVTPKEELAILRAKEDVARAEAELAEAREEGTASADELRIMELELEDAEQRLTAAKREARAKTDAVRAAEENLKDLRQEQRTMAQAVRDAEDRLTDAKLRAVQAEQSLAQAGRALLDQGPEAVGLFKQIAGRAGLSADEINRMVQKTSALTLKVGGFEDVGEAFSRKLKDIAEDANETGRSAGGAGGKVGDLGSAMDGIPDEVMTSFFANTDDAMSDIQRLREEMRRLNDAGFNVAVPGTSSGGIVMHSGGVVPGRPGQEVPAILEAGETVIPAGARPASGGGHVTVNVNGFVGNEKQLADEIGRVLVRARRAGGAQLTGAI